MSIKYEDLRLIAKNGDLFLFEGRSFISRFIRAVTGQQISHVAMLIWIGDGLWVAEMLEGRNYQLTPASQRIKELCGAGNVYYGSRPLECKGKGQIIYDTAMLYRGSKYGYLSLFKVWWSQFTRRKGTVEKLVCSTFVEKCWEAAGYEMPHLPDPGDFMLHSAIIIPVRCSHA